MTARNGSEARAAARGAAAATGANPALRSVVLDLCARHGARRILWMGRGHEPLGLSLRQAGYAVWGTDPSGNGGFGINGTEKRCKPICQPFPLPSRYKT